jgi:uncharacterized protein YfcZ (UPF0381/DUF406 family)
MIETAKQFIEENKAILYYCVDCGVLLDADNESEHDTHNQTTRMVIDFPKLHDRFFSRQKEIERDTKTIWTVEYNFISEEDTSHHEEIFDSEEKAKQFIEELKEDNPDYQENMEWQTTKDNNKIELCAVAWKEFLEALIWQK